MPYPTNEQEALVALKGDDAELAATAEAMLWGFWCRSADTETDRLFRAGVDAMQNRRLEEAEELFGRVIEQIAGIRRGLEQARDGALHAQKFQRLDRRLPANLGAQCQSLRRGGGARPLSSDGERVSRGGDVLSPGAGNPSSSRCRAPQLSGGRGRGWRERVSQLDKIPELVPIVQAVHTFQSLRI